MNELKKWAVACLARREHSRLELARKLASRGSVEEIEIVLAELERQGLLSDARFADAYVRSHALRFGAAKLRHTLRAKGVDDQTIAASMGDLPDELGRARAIWEKKFSAPADAKDWARQARFLQSRGFSADTIRKLLKNLDE